MSRSSLLVTLAFIVVLGAGAFVVFRHARGGGAPLDAVAKVAGTKISKTDFDRELLAARGRMQAPGAALSADAEAKLKASTLRRMIDDTIYRLKAAEMHLELTPAEVEREFAEYKRVLGSDERFQQFLSATHTTEEQVQQALAMNATRVRVLDVAGGTPAVTDAEIEDYFKTRPLIFHQREQVRARQIFAAFAGKSSEVPPKVGGSRDTIEVAKKIARAKIELAQKQLQGGAKFEDVARDLSDDQATRTNGGDLGYFERTRLLPPLGAIVFSLMVGATSAIVETAEGFHILKVEEHNPEHDGSLVEVRETIRKQLMAKKRSEREPDLVKALEREANVEEYLTFALGPPAMAR